MLFAIWVETVKRKCQILYTLCVFNKGFLPSSVIYEHNTYMCMMNDKQAEANLTDTCIGQDICKNCWLCPGILYLVLKCCFFGHY